MKAFGPIDGGPWTLVETKDSSATGKVNLIYANGSVVSVQPDGSIESRAPGTDAAYEQATVDGNVVTFCPDGIHAWPFALVNV